MHDAAPTDAMAAAVPIDVGFGPVAVVAGWHANTIADSTATANERFRVVIQPT